MISQENIAQLYIALFGRAPEKEGFDYWYNLAISKNWDLVTLANNMFFAASQTFPEYNDIEKVIESIYLNVLGKSPQDDPEGIQYWINQINSGNTTVGKAAADIIYVALNQYQGTPAVKTLLNRVQLGLYSKDKILDADVNNDGKIDQNDLSILTTILTKVSDDETTIEYARQEVDKYSDIDNPAEPEPPTCDDPTSKDCDGLF